ncbi:PepSY domain-containing protein [Metabacillus endolithicus]|uniref:PepSY domain-containing protein n=1 Tax=Metabacillus endolithicus TaxID=1535204 RepID=A0ABW5C3L7_9BACI
MRAKRLIIIFLLVLIGVLELLFLNLNSQKYVYITMFNTLIPILSTVIIGMFFTIVDLDLSKSFMSKITTYISIILLICVPIIYITTKPEFTYSEAQGSIKQKEKVEIIENHSKTISDNNDKLYYSIKGMKDGVLIHFQFDPYTGEHITLSLK